MAKYKDAPSIMQDEKVCFLSGSLGELNATISTAEPTAATAQNTAYGYGFGMTYTTSRPTECILTSTTTACYSG